jgi:hypothetical protein
VGAEGGVEGVGKVGVKRAERVEATMMRGALAFFK